MNLSPALLEDQREFVKAICAVPEDDTPRLVYADWLQDRGEEARAEFIRSQCRDESADRQRRFWVDGALWHILDEFRPIWPDNSYVHLLIDKPVDWMPRKAELYVSRGFISEVTCTAEEWLAHADELYWSPGQKCRRCDGDGRIGGFASDDTYDCSVCDGSGNRPFPSAPRTVKCRGCDQCKEGMIYTGKDGMKWIPHMVTAPPILPHPITRVNLTTNPNGLTDGRYLLGSFPLIGPPEDRVFGPFTWNDGRWDKIEFVVGWFTATAPHDAAGSA